MMKKSALSALRSLQRPLSRSCLSTKTRTTLSTLATSPTCQIRSQSCQSKPKPQAECHSRKQPATLSPIKGQFWTSKSAWKRASINTFRCLVGCTLGDFSAMWYLQSSYPELGMQTIMIISMASGITSSVLLETTLLRFGRDRLRWMAAARTAVGMSMISMITMELAENIVDYHLTGGVVQFDDPTFWLAAGASKAAGFLAPLPYNYLRLKKYGKACH